LLAEVRHQRDALERQLAVAEAAQRDLRQLLLGRQPPPVEYGPGPMAGVGDGDAPDGQPAIEPREPTLGEWWRDIDRMRRLGASLILSAIVSFIAALGFHFLLAAHLIDPVFRLGYIFAVLGILLFIAGAGMLF